MAGGCDLPGTAERHRRSAVMHRTRRQTVMVIKRLSRRLRRLSEEDFEEIPIGGPLEPDASMER